MVIFNGGSKSPITRKKNIGPPTIYYKNCHNRGLAHVPCMTRTPTRYPHRFIWVWCVDLDPRSPPNNWGHSKPTLGYVYGLCVPRSQLGPTNPRDYKIVNSFCVSNGSASNLRQFPVSYLAIHGHQFEDRTLLCAKTTKFAPL